MFVEVWMEEHKQWTEKKEGRMRLGRAWGRKKRERNNGGLFNSTSGNVKTGDKSGVWFGSLGDRKRKRVRERAAISSNS